MFVKGIDAQQGRFGSRDVTTELCYSMLIRSQPLSAESAWFRWLNHTLCCTAHSIASFNGTTPWIENVYVCFQCWLSKRTADVEPEVNLRAKLSEGFTLVLMEDRHYQKSRKEVPLVPQKDLMSIRELE